MEWKSSRDIYSKTLCGAFICSCGFEMRAKTSRSSSTFESMSYNLKLDQHFEMILISFDGELNLCKTIRI